MGKGGAFAGLERGCGALSEWIDREHAAAIDRESRRCWSSSAPDLLSSIY